MTDQSRHTRSRRSGRRPGWLLLSALLVLAIAASSALVFTNRVELLKLAVILALWAAVVGAFVSVIYRRQSDVDQARARDLKLVYDLQLDREISARREYELEVESQLRRELASELRGQASDEVAALRAELAALRNNLEILFEADLAHRPAIETPRTTVHAYSDWDRPVETTDPGRATAPSPPRAADVVAENAIIDVREEPSWAEPEPTPQRRRHAMDEGPGPAAPQPAAERVGRHGQGWNPAPAEGQWLPAGTPGSNWTASNGVSPTPRVSEPAPAGPPSRGRHAGPSEPHAAPAAPAARHSGDAAAPAPPAPPSVDEGGGQHRDGQPVAELLNWLAGPTGSTGGGRRRRRDD